jgi:hypothetical protein
LIAVSVIRIKQAILATVKLYIVMGDDMNRTPETGPGYFITEMTQLLVASGY